MEDLIPSMTTIESNNNDNNNMSSSPPRSPSKVDCILFNGDNGPASQLLLNTSNNGNDISNLDSSNMSSSSSDGDDDPSEEGTGEDQSNDPLLLDNILRVVASPEAVPTPPRNNGGNNNDPHTPTELQHKVQFAGIDSPSNSQALPEFNVMKATRSQLYQRLDFMQQRLTQVQIDLSGEKAMRKRKEKNLMKLAKELSRRQKQTEKHESQIAKMAEVVLDLERKLAKAEQTQGDRGRQAQAAAASVGNNNGNNTASSVSNNDRSQTPSHQQEILQAKLESDRLRTAVVHANREVDRLHSVVANTNREANRLRSALSSLEMENKELEYNAAQTMAHAQELHAVLAETNKPREMQPVSNTPPSSTSKSAPAPESSPPPPSPSPLSFSFLFPKKKKSVSPSLITTSGSMRSINIKTASSSADVRFSALLVTIATALMAAFLLYTNRELFQMNALCAPTKPGTLLPPMKSPFADKEDNIDDDDKEKAKKAATSSFVAPWWAPASYKEAAFQAVCQGRGHMPVELQWHENGILSATNMDNGKSLMRKSFLAGAQIDATQIVLTSQTGATEEIVAPWASNM